MTLYFLERETRLELATYGLGSHRATIAPLPLEQEYLLRYAGYVNMAIATCRMAIAFLKTLFVLSVVFLHYKEYKGNKEYKER